MWQTSRASRLRWTDKWDLIEPGMQESPINQDVGSEYSRPLKLVIRAPQATNMTGNVNTTITGNTASTSPVAHKSLVPHWSYEKNSIAVAIAISVVAVLGLITLVTLFVQKVRRSWGRRQEEKIDYADPRFRAFHASGDAENGMCERKLSRESVMFSKGNSAPKEYVVEQQGDRITRVVCAGKKDAPKALDSVDKPSQQQESSVEPPSSELPVKNDHDDSTSQPNVVVPPPLKHASSLKATPTTQQWDSNPEKPSASRRPAGEARRSIIKLASAPGSLFRLPSIKRTTSPIFNS
ncbi:hypothetical protein EYZ11_000464 [Aspergillus tanneri]|nr:hypothetical protein EYZ11_000464 [Aspergillus tanneri]